MVDVPVAHVVPAHASHELALQVLDQLRWGVAEKGEHRSSSAPAEAPSDPLRNPVVQPDLSAQTACLVVVPLQLKRALAVIRSPLPELLSASITAGLVTGSISGAFTVAVVDCPLASPLTILSQCLV